MIDAGCVRPTFLGLMVIFIEQAPMLFASVTMLLLNVQFVNKDVPAGLVSATVAPDGILMPVAADKVVAFNFAPRFAV